MAASSPLITLFGATGFTGQLVAQTLAREGLTFRIAGRDADRLQSLSNRLPGQPPILVADATQPATLSALFSNTRLLINCAGPFTDLGERVIAQAALGGVHYLDTTNELGFVFKARGYAAMAQRTGAALVPACAFEVALADCAAHLAGAALIDPDHPGPLDAVNIVYALDGKGSSAGTRRSAIRSLATSWIAYRDGEWTGQMPGKAVRRFHLPASEPYAMLFPSCESITVPAHLPVRQVDTWMTIPPSARFFTPIFVPLLARLSRSVLRGLILKIAASGGFTSQQSQDPQLRAEAPFTIYTEARRGAKTSQLSLEGNDPYGLTAEIITYAARQLIQPEFSQRGLLAPAQALNPQAFLEYAQAHWGIQCLR